MGNAGRAIGQSHYRFCEGIQTARRENGHYRSPQTLAWTYGWTKYVRGQLPPRLGQLAQQIGASERTISRVFIRDTGMNYHNWRPQWRLLKSMEMLSDGWQLSYVVQQLEFASDSAFITFFRQHTGTTPAYYSLKNIAEKKHPMTVINQ